MLDSSLNFCDRGRSSFHVVGKILVEIIKIIAVEVETLRGVILRFMDIRDVNREDFSAEILKILVLLAS